MASSKALVEGVGRGATSGILSTLLDLTSDAVICFDAMGRILTANAQATMLTGLSLDELRDTDIRDLLFDAGSSLGPFVAETPKSHSKELALAQGPSSIIERPLPLPIDASLCELSLRLAQGGSAAVGVRCDRAVAPGDTYVLVMRPLDATVVAQREHDRLLDELSLANRRLSGTLRIVLETIDVQDVEVLFNEVLEQISETLEASGTLLYLAEASGFRLQGLTRSLESREVPQFLAYGEGIETLATKAGGALRLRLMPPSEKSLRMGALKSRELYDEDSATVRRIPARQVPPFTSLICVPIWYGGRVIGLLQVGWGQARPVRKDDARLLESVSRYLSVELAAALSSMRAERVQHFEDLATQFHDQLEQDQALASGDFSEPAQRLCHELGARIAPIECVPYQNTCVVSLPEAGAQDLPHGIDELVEGYVDGEVAVVSFGAASPLGSWMASQGCPGSGALIDLGELGGKRRAAIVWRGQGEEPFDEMELSLLHRVCVDARRTVLAGERRRQDTRIAQALQSGMRNELQQVKGITAHGLYSSATEAALVGGDFYDLIRLPGRRACVILGDVSGKGVEAASVSAAVRTALGAYAWEGQPPARMVRLLNDFLLGFSRLETFATLFVGMIDLAHASIAYCSAGHPPALLLRARTGELETLDVQSGVVGAFEAMTYRDGHVRLERGDRLMLYTDGVIEARSRDGSFFGEQGLHDALMEEATGDFEGLLDRILGRLDAFTERSLEDDVAMVTLRFDELGQQEAGAK